MLNKTAHRLTMLIHRLINQILLRPYPLGSPPPSGYNLMKYIYVYNPLSDKNSYKFIGRNLLKIEKER
jgi:hypothetical protein